MNRENHPESFTSFRTMFSFESAVWVAIPIYHTPTVLYFLSSNAWGHFILILFSLPCFILTLTQSTPYLQFFRLIWKHRKNIHFHKTWPLAVSHNRHFLLLVHSFSVTLGCLMAILLLYLLCKIMKSKCWSQHRVCTEVSWDVKQWSWRSIHGKLAKLFLDDMQRRLLRCDM